MNFSSKLFKPFLFLTSQIYKAAVLLRLLCYKNGWLKTHQPETPVISVGNLTVGGTGKTPVVDFLVKGIQNQKMRPAILSRGYRRKNTSTQQRFRFCEDSTIDPEITGDEPFLLALRNPEVPVYVGSSRITAAHSAKIQDHPDVLILDDAYQHLAIQRDLNILLIDAERGLGNGSLLPLGILREPVNQWLRADVIIITKTNLAASDSVMKMLKNELKINCPVFKFSFEPQSLSRLDRQAQLSLLQLKGKHLLLISGIAQPAGFGGLLELQGANVIGKLEFQDHHDYVFKDVQKILHEHEKMQPDYIVTTEKDAVKLRKFPELLEKLWILEIGVHPEDSWNDYFTQFLNNL